MSSNTIYSLRETKKLKDNYTINKSHLTAAIGDDDGFMYQLKGPKNSKPKPEFFPYIVDLILNTNIIKLKNYVGKPSDVLTFSLPG